MRNLILATILLLSSAAQAEYTYSDFWDTFIETFRGVKKAELSCDEFNQNIDKMIEIEATLPEWRQKITQRLMERTFYKTDFEKSCLTND